MSNYGHSREHPQADSSLTDLPTKIQSPPSDFFGVGSILKQRYEIKRELAHGGFSVVYLAEDRQIHSRRVVVKLL